LEEEVRLGFLAGFFEGLVWAADDNILIRGFFDVLAELFSALEGSGFCLGGTGEFYYAGEWRERELFALF